MASDVAPADTAELKGATDGGARRDDGCADRADGKDSAEKRCQGVIAILRVAFLSPRMTLHATVMP